MQKTTKNYVINLQGKKEPFSFQKVYRSARRVGASKKVAQKIADSIKKDLRVDGIKTSEIFKKVKKELRQQEPQAALRFNLKQGMRKLGPTGFPFEKYVGKIFNRNGFRVQLNQHIPGLCTSYEIDFLAKKGNLLYIGECKYRNDPGGRTHLDTALANYARFLDIKKGGFFQKTFKNLRIKSLLVTNTKLTSQAIRYSECVGVECLGWKYPKNQGLEHIIDTKELYPITILPSLRNYLAKIFVSQNIMMAEDILKLDIEKFAKKTRVPLKHLIPLVRQAKILLEKN